MAFAIFNSKNRCENCHHYLLNENIKRHESELKEKLRSSIKQVTDYSVNELRASQCDVTSLVSNTEKMSFAVNESSEAVNRIIEKIVAIDRILEANAAAVESLENATAVGKENLGNVSSLVSEIEENSSGLVEMSNVIQKIASQTNLLAMNAAIEAAHAGGFGKGFAVVADEIRKLAEQSNRQGKVIKGSLKELSASLTAIAQSIGEVRAKFESIYDVAKVVKEQEIVVMNAMTEQNEGNRQVLDAMKAINDSTVHVKDSSVEMLSGAEQVAEEMTHLAAVTKKINDSMESISNGVGEISTAMDLVTQSSSKNQQDINTLAAEIGTFKLKDA
jgi:methyl-accepting chemotaxis protein